MVVAASVAVVSPAASASASPENECELFGRYTRAPGGAGPEPAETPLPIASGSGPRPGG